MTEMGTLPPDCPPEAAAAIEGTFYRLVGGHYRVGDVPQADAWTLPYRNRKGACAGHPDVCACHALSVFEDMGDAYTAKQVVPAFRNKAIVQVKLSEADGVGLNTPVEFGKSHYDWWPRHADQLPDAVVVEEV